MADPIPAENGTSGSAPIAKEPVADTEKAENPTAEGSTPSSAAVKTQAESSDTPSDTTSGSTATGPVVSASKRSRPPYKYDPNKITLRFLFANRDGLTVTVECKPADTVGEVKGALLSVWPEDLPNCSGGDRLRLICMGKGVLMPDSRTLEDCQVPVFKTHPTPINVSVRPENIEIGVSKETNEGKGGRGGHSGSNGPSASRPPSGSSGEADQGCACIIL